MKVFKVVLLKVHVSSSKRFSPHSYLRLWLGWQSCQPIDLFDAPVEIVVKKESLEIKRTLVNVSTEAVIKILYVRG